MEPIRKTPRGPPVGYVIDGHRYFTVAEGVRIVGPELICFQTLTCYALDFHRPPEVPQLTVISQPLLRTSRSKPRSDQTHRLLLEEKSLLQLREFLQERGGAGWRRVRAARQIARSVPALNF